ncbi:MAG TPA: TetR/AcrR family transcriptional regulator [Verrucomicrobiae bacterium]|nr:TetR/AcrR family transcriptional regulator [Verrucomicrobiae bacterium]
MKRLLTLSGIKTYVLYIRLRQWVQSTAKGAEESTFETRRRIIKSAERLFAMRGIEAVSIRDITKAARVNLAAINYHFGTKSALAAEVFKHCIEPLNVRRLELLDAVEKKAGDKGPRLEAVLEAMIRPAVERGFDQEQGEETFLRLMGRCLSEPNVEIEQLVRAHLEKVIRRFDAAFLRALPGLEPEELFWRMKFMFGALHFSLLTCGKQANLPPKLRKTLDAEGLLQRLVTFTAAGLQASVLS